MIPTSSMIPTVMASLELGSLLAPVAMLGFVAVLVAFGVLLVRLATDVESAPESSALPQVGGRVSPALRHAA